MDLGGIEWLSHMRWPPRKIPDSTVAACALPNDFRAGDRMRGRGFVLADEDVSAPGPSVETGASVPGQREVNFPVEH